MPDVPRDDNLESTLALLSDPYGFIPKKCRALGSDVFETRLLLRKTLCMTGREAAALFYESGHFTRRNAAPRRLQKTLFGVGGVQGLDAATHRHRKQMLLSFLGPDRIHALANITEEHWRKNAQAWTGRDRIVLYDSCRELLCRAVCDWAGVPLAEAEASRRTRDLSALFQYAGAVGYQHVRSRLARRHAERWAADLIQQVRTGALDPAAQSALHTIALHRDLNGVLLSRHVAAVELLNVLRPTVAVAVFITLAALALYDQPGARGQLQSKPGYMDAFIQEVRRFYPFFPAIVARVSEDFEWNGFRFHKGRRAILDLAGTNHDPRTWDAPWAFMPERFLRETDDDGKDGVWLNNRFGFIPQGGGDHAIHHRCPGEWITELMKVAVRFLTQQITYDVPDQDLRIDRRALPALPRSGFVISRIRPAQP